MRDPRTIFHVSSELKQFFFSTDHCQPKVHNSYVPISSYVDDKNSVRSFWGKELGYKEVPNPNPLYEPKYSLIEACVESDNPVNSLVRLGSSLLVPSWRKR